VALDRMPVLVRSGAVIPQVPMDPAVSTTADLEDRPWVLHAYGETPRDLTLTGFDGTPTSVVLESGRTVAIGTQAVAGEVVAHDG
jgi:hypothetical protein